VRELKKDGEVVFSIPICHACNQEREEREQLEAELDRKAMERKFAESVKASLAKRIKDANIPERFENSKIDDYEFYAEGHIADQKKAVEDVRWFLENWQRSAGLIMMGHKGTGKTMLACGVLNEVLQKGYTALFTEVTKIDRAFKDTWRKDTPISETELLAKLTNYDVMVIDEVGVQRATLEELLRITELVNDRYKACKPTIFIGNMDLDELKALVGERAIDRLGEVGRKIIFDWEGYRGRVEK
jgi:DNA replication protein DnaC